MESRRTQLSCRNPEVVRERLFVDCKTVCIFAYLSTREQSSKRSGARLSEARAIHACEALTLTKPILRKKLKFQRDYQSIRI